MASEMAALPAAVRARTILAACDQAELSDSRGVPRCRLNGLLERDGEIFVVPAPGEHVPTGLLQLVCQTPVPGLGALILTTRAGNVVGELPGFGHSIIANRPGANDGSGPDIPEPMELAEALAVEMVIVAVRVLIPRNDDDVVVRVPLPEFRTAEPDRWLLDGGRIATHLARFHQRELRALVGCGIDTEVIASRVNTSGMELACLDPHGVSALRVVYGEKIDRPIAVCYWLSRTVRAA